MRIATYNVMSGGFDNYGSAAARPERLGLLQEAIKLIDADVIGLVDTFRWKDIYTAQDLIDLFGYPHVFHINMDDSRVNKRIGLAVLSRLPLKRAEVIQLHNRNGIVATVSENNQDADIFVAYLDDLSETTRLDEARALIGVASETRPTVVMGDLNAIVPVDAKTIKQGVDEFLATEHGRQHAETLRSMVASMLEVKVLPAFAQAGFQVPTGPSSPTALTSIHPFRMPQPVFPVDHILVKGGVLSDRRRLTGGVFEQASDHYPVVADINLG